MSETAAAFVVMVCRVEHVLRAARLFRIQFQRQLRRTPPPTWHRGVRPSFCPAAERSSNRNDEASGCVVILARLSFQFLSDGGLFTSGHDTVGLICTAERFSQNHAAPQRFAEIWITCCLPGVG